MEERIHYVYMHTDPASDDLLYVGHGCRGRSWTSLSHSEDHTFHLEMMTKAGYTADDWVSIVEAGLTKRAACDIERHLIDDLHTMYNKVQGFKLLKLTPKDLTLAMELRDTGMSYQSIAKQFDVFTMVVWRALTGNTKSMGLNYAR